MNSGRGITAWCLMELAAAGGCARVEPRFDYDRLEEHVRQATGQTDLYRPEEDALVEERVEGLLRDGLTAEEAVRVYLFNNRKLQAALFDIGVARADVVTAGLLSNPSLALSLRFPDSGGLANLEAGLAQNLADLWQIPTRRRVAERTLERAILTVARETGAAVAEVKTAYFRAKQADRKREIAAESVQIAQQVLELALARQQAGAGGEIDVNLARSEVLDAELSLRLATFDAFQARSELVTLLALPTPPDALELTDAPPEPPDWSVADETLLALAGEHRLDLQAAQSAAEAAQAAVRAEWLKVFPTLELGVALERAERRATAGRNILADSTRASFDAGQPTVDIAPKEGQDGQDTIIGPTLGMELPIFNQNQGSIARAQFAYEQSLKLLDGLNLQVMQEVRLANARARTAGSNVRFYREQMLPLRESSLDLARTAYQAGRTPLLNVLEAQRALLNARAGHADSLQASAGALVELEKATGQPLPRIIEAARGTDQNALQNERKDESP